MKTYSLPCVYGSQNTPDTVHVLEQHNGLKWYAVDDSVNVSATYDDIESGVDVEMLRDVDAFTWSDRINSLEDLETAVNA